MAVNVTLNVYGYESFSMFVFCLLCMCSYAFIFTRSNSYAAWLGVLMGIAVAARLSNGLDAFPLSLTILASVRVTGGRWRKSVLVLSIFAAASPATYLVLFTAYDCSVGAEPGWDPISPLVESLRSDYLEITNLRGTHPPDTLIKNLVRDMDPIFAMALSIGLISWSGKVPHAGCRNYMHGASSPSASV